MSIGKTKTKQQSQVTIAFNNKTLTQKKNNPKIRNKTDPQIRNDAETLSHSLNWLNANTFQTKNQKRLYHLYHEITEKTIHGLRELKQSLMKKRLTKTSYSLK